MNAIHDRYGELVDEDEHQAHVEHHQPHYCDGGWIDRDSDQPRPCPVCRPHLVQRRERLGPADPDRIRAGLALCRQALAQARSGAAGPERDQ